MSYVSLLFSPATQELLNASAMRGDTELDVRASLDAGDNAYNGTGSGVGSYRLPSGIQSLDHWLDLNA